MSSAAKVGIVQFAGEGYDVWRFRVETQMSAHGVKEMLTKDVPMDEAQLAAFREKDEKAKALLVAYIADSHLEYVRDKDTAKEMWNSLANTFAKKGFATQTYIRRSLATLKMVEGTPLMDHFRRFDELIRQLKGAGATVSELDAVSQLFISLPSSYDVVTTAMENLGDDQLKLDTVKARLLAEEQKRSGRERFLRGWCSGWVRISVCSEAGEKQGEEQVSRKMLRMRRSGTQEILLSEDEESTW